MPFAACHFQHPGWSGVAPFEGRYAAPSVMSRQVRHGAHAKAMGALLGRRTTASGRARARLQPGSTAKLPPRSATA